jgi:hypothetical protein
MLWYKGWLETRARILFALVFILFPVALRVATPRLAPPTLAAEQGSIAFFAFYWSVVPVILAGAGVKTQAGLRATRGFHGSMYFTLTLPVSRLRLLAVRAAVGLLETAAVLATVPFVVWILFPLIRARLSTPDLLEYWAVISVCGCAFYFLGVVFASVLDDWAQNMASMLSIVALQAIFANLPMPGPLNIFRAMGEASPIFTHALPWVQMGVSLSVAAVLFCIAGWVVQTRQY